jgi:hypothetical protein
MIKKLSAWFIFFAAVTSVWYGGYICGMKDAPPYKDKIYLQGCTDKHYIVVGTKPSEINPKGVSFYSNKETELIVMSPDKEMTQKILDVIDKALWEVSK